MTDLTTLASVKAWLGLLGKPISAITRANPAVVTCPGHGLTANTVVAFAGLFGMTQLNGQTAPIALIDANTFSVPIDTTAYGAYTGGGLIGLDDALLARVITAISAETENMANRHFAQASYTETRNGRDGTEMMVMNYPIVSVSSVTVDGVAIPARTSPTGTGFVNDDDTIYLSGYAFTRGVRNVQLAYVGGYAAIPAGLDQAVVESVAFLYRERDRIGLSSKGLANETTAFLRDLPPHLMRRLRGYAAVGLPI